jgi:hypothetical protein
MKATSMIVLCYHDSVRYSGYMFGSFRFAKINPSLNLAVVSSFPLSFSPESNGFFSYQRRCLQSEMPPRQSMPGLRGRHSVESFVFRDAAM